MNDFLQDAALLEYAEIFEEKGFDSLDHLLEMGQQDLLELKRLTNMKDGHFVRFQSTVKVWRAPATPSTASAPATPISVGPASVGPINLGPVDVDPIDMGPASMGPASVGPNEMGPMGPNHPDVGPVSLSPPKASLRKAYANWAQTRLVSLNYSTQLGCSAMMDNKKSGGRRKILRCRTALSKKKKNNNEEEDDADDGPNCPHMLLWTRDRTGDWRLNWDKSILEHKPFCNSGQIVTKFQLVRDPEFVKSQRLGKLSTGKEAAKLALGYNGRMSGSVKEYTVRRARDTIKHYNANDYDDDWSKLNQWGHQFMEMNPQSLFHLEKDDEGRSVIRCYM